MTQPLSTTPQPLSATPQPLSATPQLWMLIAWTWFLWLSRLRNVLTDEDLSSTGRAVRVGVVVIFVALATAAALVVRRQQFARKIIVVFLAWTVGYWLVRGTGILIDGDYSASFKAVHTVLMLVSLTLSALAARQLWLRR